MILISLIISLLSIFVLYFIISDNDSIINKILDKIIHTETDMKIVTAVIVIGIIPVINLFTLLVSSIYILVKTLSKD